MKVAESMKRAAAEVLIVGAGPVGLFLATELLRRGRTVLLIERRDGPSTHSKALALMPRTLEIFELAHVERPFVAALNRIDSVRFFTPSGSAQVEFGSLPTSYRHVSMLPQWKTEAILAARVAELGGMIHYAHELRNFEQDAGGITATIETLGGTLTARAEYIVGCDGAWSRVRELAGIPFEGRSYPLGSMLADAQLDTAIPRNEAQVHFYSKGVVTIFPMDQQLRRIVAIEPESEIPPIADRSWLQERLDRANAKARVDGVVWSSAFHVHRRIARRMRAGHVLLAGDAAHIHSPVGGQGMNLGLHDAWNLGWKLAFALAGDAPEILLDTYERERLPAARDVVRRTDMLTHALADPRPPMRAARRLLAPVALRMRTMHALTARRLAQLDMPYAPRIPDIRLSDGSRLYARFETGYGVVVEGGSPPLHAKWLTAYLAPPHEAHGELILVRPDGYIAYKTRNDDAFKAIARALSYLRKRGLTIAT